MQKDALHELIHKLSPTEKRYFRRFTALHGRKGKAYLDLFDLLEKQPVYDEIKLKAALHRTTFVDHLASGKNYLYQQLLKSLRLYHGEQRALFRVYGLLEDVHILLEKNLVRQAAKRIQKALKLAKAYHLDSLHLELLLLDRQLIRSFEQKQAARSIEKNQVATQKNLQQIQGQVAMIDLYDQIFLAIRDRMQIDDPEGQLGQQLDQLSLSLDPTEMSFTSRMSYHLSLANYAMSMRRDLEQAQSHMHAILQLFEAEPHLVDEYPNRYINVVNNYLNLHYLQHNFTPFAIWIPRLEAVRPRTEYLKIKLFQTLYSLKLIECLGLRQYQKALVMLPEIIRQLKRYQKKIHKAFQLEFYQNIALVYFHLKEFTEALDWLNRVVQASKQDIRQDITDLCRCLQLIVHFELEHEDLVQSLARSILRHRDSRVGIAAYQWLARKLGKIILLPPRERSAQVRQLAAEPAELELPTAIKHWLADRLK